MENEISESLLTQMIEDKIFYFETIQHLLSTEKITSFFFFDENAESIHKMFFSSCDISYKDDRCLNAVPSKWFLYEIRNKTHYHCTILLLKKNYKKLIKKILVLEQDLEKPCLIYHVQGIPINCISPTYNSLITDRVPPPELRTIVVVIERKQESQTIPLTCSPAVLFKFRMLDHMKDQYFDAIDKWVQELLVDEKQKLKFSLSVVVQ